ncbi:MAG: pilin [Patescibacteria group bacterium]
MKTKIQILFTALLVLPIVALLFGGVATAADESADECTTEDDCNTALAEAVEKFQTATTILNNFSDCSGACNFATDLWFRCSIIGPEGAQMTCDGIYDTGSTKTGKTNTLEIIAALSKSKTELSAKVTELQQRVNRFKSADIGTILSVTVSNNQDRGNLQIFIDKVIDLAAKMVGLTAFVFLVIGGFRLVAAAGNDNQIQKAKTMIIYSIAGLTIVLLAYIIVAAVQGLLYR